MWKKMQSQQDKNSEEKFLNSSLGKKIQWVKKTVLNRTNLRCFLSSAFG